MRCKPGDVARILVSRWQENIGRAVDVIEPLAGFPGVWKCHAREERIMTNYGAVMACCMFDASLLPINPNEWRYNHDDVAANDPGSEIRTTCEAADAIPSPN